MAGTADITPAASIVPAAGITTAAGIAPAAPIAPDERLAAAFGTHVARWAREQGASAEVAEIVQRAAICVSQATSDGHSCAGLEELADTLDREGRMTRNVAALRDLLLESGVVGTAEAPDSQPLILDEDRLYLHRYFDYECRLASSLAARIVQRSAVDRSGEVAENTLPPTMIALLGRLFGAHALASDAPDWQRIAVVTALLGRVTIISGGPGTGKTTTVVNLLACLLEEDPECRIALTAPTGKAAARLTEVILQRADHLPDTLRARLPAQSSTIHRLLGGTPGGEFRHNAANPLPIDVLVVDEASMLDLALAVHLIEAVPSNARIVLLGDKDQLAAVESGAVFSELSAGPQTRPPDLAAGPRGLAASPPGLAARLEEGVIWLRRNYRFAAGSAIGLLAAEIRDGDAGRVLERLEDPADPSLTWIKEAGDAPSTQSVRAMLEGYASYIEAVRGHADDPLAVAHAFARLRVLCAVRDGPWGVNAINQQVGLHCRRTLRHPLDPGLRSEWYPGRPVMVLRNDPVLKVFNGDIGLVLPDDHGVLQVYFPDERGGFRAIAPVRLPEHETAFAMTVHKSQGSEFEEVVLVLPAEKNRILTRELFYTAVTRARERLTLIANAPVVASTTETATKRLSGLLARVRRCAS